MRLVHTAGSATAGRRGRLLLGLARSVAGTGAGFVSGGVFVTRSPSWVPSLPRSYPASALLRTL